tara:strand:- start:232 stop:495 length:264 start_codon:yes stop_codon:yes gene_type:complete
VTIALSRNVNGSEAVRIATALGEHVDRSEPLLMDGGEVDQIGMAGLQVLLAAKTTAASVGLPFRLDNPSKPLSEMTALAGLDDLLTS